MKLVDKIHVEGLIDNDYDEFGFVEENYRSDDSMCITVDAHVVSKLLNELNKEAKELINEKETDYECGDIRDVTLDNVGFQLYFTKDKTTLEQAQEYLILDTFGGLNGYEGWFGYSEWTILGYHTGSFEVGGHNIMDILVNHAGQYCHIVMSVYE